MCPDHSYLMLNLDWNHRKMQEKYISQTVPEHEKHRLEYCPLDGLLDGGWALNLSPWYGYAILVTLAYMEGWTNVRSYGRTVNKTKFSRIDGLPYFLNYGAPLLFNNDSNLSIRRFLEGIGKESLTQSLSIKPSAPITARYASPKN